MGCNSGKPESVQRVQRTCASTDQSPTTKIHASTEQSTQTKTIINTDQPPPPPQIVDVLNPDLTVNQVLCWCDVLPNGQIVLLSTNRTRSMSRLSLYSADKKPLTKGRQPIQAYQPVGLYGLSPFAAIHTLDLPLAASAGKMEDYQIIVAVVETSKLQVVGIEDGTLVKGPAFDVKLVPKLVLRYSVSSLITLAQQTDGKWCFQILDLAGRLQKRIEVKHKLRNPQCMTISKDGKVIYLVDVDKGCLGFNQDGEVTFHFIYSNCDDHIQYNGLVRDPGGALYLSVWFKDGGSNRTIKISPAGHVLRQMDIGGKLPWKISEEKLYIAGKNDQGKWVISYIKM